MANILQIVVLLGVFVLAPTVGVTQDTDPRLADRVLGDADAPVTIVEYSSLTCPHCADFHLQTLPQIKENYIDTGKAKLIFRDFPLDPRALAAAMIARCIDPSRYYGFLDLLFRDQKVWARSDDIVRELKVRAQLALLPEDKFNACIQDRGLAQAIETKARKVSEEEDINSTPSFLVDDVTVRGALPYDQFSSIIEKRLSGDDPHEAGTKAEPGEQDAGFVARTWNSIKGLWTSH